jgi:hypothetical protein
MNMGAHRLGNKATPYATHIPFLVSWPTGRGETPGVVSERIQNIDLAPTLCEIAGCTLGPYPSGQNTPDGKSFLGLLLGTQADMGRDAVLDSLPRKWPQRPAAPVWYATTSTALSPLAFEGCLAAASGGCKWHYVEYASGEEELYDLSNGPCWTWQAGQPGDPCELENQAGNPAYAAIKVQLQSVVTELKAE